MGRLRIPEGRRLFGANVVPPAVDVVPDGGQAAWTNLFLNWADRWPNWIKPQVDYLTGNGVGVNCIRMIGAQEGIPNGLFSQDYHDSCIEQLATYCRSLGVHYFLCTGGLQTGLSTAITAGLTPAGLAAIEATTIHRIAQLDNVIGVDLIQEAQAVGSLGTPQFTIPLLIEVKRLIGDLLPITCSASMINTAFGVPSAPTGAPGEAWYLDRTWGRVGDYVDFFSGHLYERNLDSTWFAQFTAAFPDKDIIIGEFGRALDSGVASQVSYLNRYFGMGAAPIRQVRGALLWAGFDQNVTDDQRWGVYSDALVARPWMLDIVKRFTGGSTARNNGVLW